MNLAGITLVAFVLLAMFGCSQAPTAKEQDPNYAPVSARDEELDAAIAKARATLDEFIAELKNPAGRTIRVKAKLPTTKGSYEHIWIEDVSYSDGRFSGTLGNDPWDLGDLKFGSPVAFEREAVVDWLIDDGKSIRGDYTMPVLLKRQRERKGGE